MTRASGYRVLVVEDNTNERQSLVRLLTDAGYTVYSAESADKAVSYLEESIDFVITDIQMGDLSGLDLLKHWKRQQPDAMFLVITGHGSPETAQEAIRAGAWELR